MANISDKQMGEIVSQVIAGLKAEPETVAQAVAVAPAKGGTGRRPARADEAPGPVKTTTPKAVSFTAKEDNEEQARIAEIAMGIDVSEIPAMKDKDAHTLGYFGSCVKQAKQGQNHFCLYMDGKLPGEHKGLLSTTAPRYQFSQMLFDALVDEEVWS